MNENLKQPATAIGIGNVVIDRLITLPQAEILALGYPEKSMSLIDDKTADEIARKFVWRNNMAGGSVGNSLATIAALTRVFVDANAARQVQFHGVATDDAGATTFEQSFGETGGQAILHKIKQSHTGQCFCFVDDDHGDRTMLANLGSNLFFHHDKLQAETLATSRLIFLEGYIFDSQDSKAAFEKIVTSKPRGQQIALTLSDHFCVMRHGADFLALIKQGVDIVFANEAEILALTKTSDFNTAISVATKLAPIIVITRSEKGVVVLQQGKDMLVVPGEKNIKVLDATGAGDQLAGGFLFGLLQHWPMEKSASLGCHLAAAIIQRWGARLPIDRTLLADYMK
ncbi:MAG: adenosine kinase [Hydrotalea sp.]|nr:adenosine kinase [Hydrotalea sp.]